MSCLKPGESLKVPSKSYDMIASEIKKRLQIPSVTVHFREPLEDDQIVTKEEQNGHNEEEDEKDCGEKVLSKLIVTEKYDTNTFTNIKQAINRELVTNEVNKEVYKRHYLDELNKWQKRKRNSKDYELSIEKVTTHPKGKEELENKKLINLKQKVVTNIPQPHEKKVRFIRSEIRKPEHIDTYSTDIWSFREIQKFINLFFEHYKNFEEIQTKLPHKSVHELIALYDLLKPTLLLKKLYKKAKQKPSAVRKEYIKNIVPKIQERLIYQLRKLIFANNSTQLIIPLSETKFSRADLIQCFIYDESDKNEFSR